MLRDIDAFTVLTQPLVCLLQPEEVSLERLRVLSRPVWQDWRAQGAKAGRIGWGEGVVAERTCGRQIPWFCPPHR